MNAIDTAALIAEQFFYGPPTAAIATSDSWYDALTGGAMSGALYGPLLINPKYNLDPRVAGYLTVNASSLYAVELLGSNNSLADSLIAPVGNAIGVPGTYLYTPYPVILGVASGRANLAKTASPSNREPVVAGRQLVKPSAGLNQ